MARKGRASTGAASLASFLAVSGVSSLCFGEITQRMEILVITWNFPPRRGGMEALLSNLCSGLKKNHSVYVITAYAAAPDAAADTVFRAPLPGLLSFFLYAL